MDKFVIKRLRTEVPSIVELENQLPNRITVTADVHVDQSANSAVKKNITPRPHSYVMCIPHIIILDEFLLKLF